ncbi:uncharacterized protein BO72DRAFT_247326 [Aspergillus fijiensis CBS 313.89]|uniref:Uncharacterized protein n=1 Tax=Aspergillus fijiensis CBS 313.89 TaxID=1448319 RepID=A0A8G1VUC1_9EURO|nr:uncharacterized protein BO72DRAFT_247326 [Aspergillus fijiensis CBS 313.89]RAK73260.1 hypothetical protein BO72DRAFT_247326 [Aspergillus fijiensis CBS 313.89]
MPRRHILPRTCWSECPAGLPAITTIVGARRLTVRFLRLSSRRPLARIGLHCIYGGITLAYAQNKSSGLDRGPRRSGVGGP